MKNEPYLTPDTDTSEDFSPWDFSLDSLLAEEGEEDWEALLADYPEDEVPPEAPEPMAEMDFSV